MTFVPNLYQEHDVNYANSNQVGNGPRTGVASRLRHCIRSHLWDWKSDMSLRKRDR